MKVFIYNVIDSNTSKGILKDLSKPFDSDEITVHINSPGGSVLDGYAIYNQLRTSGKKITVNIDGMAGSIASVIAMAANTINISEAGRMMIHNPTAGIKGDAKQLALASETLKDFESDLVRIYANKTKLPQKTIRNMMNAETILTAKEAVELGFADNMINPIKAVAEFDLNNMNILEKLQSLAQFQKEEKPDDEVTKEIEAKVTEELEAAKTSEDPAQLLMQDYTALKDFSEFKNSSESFMDAMIDFVKGQPTKEEIETSIKEITNKMFIEFIGKIKSQGSVPTKTETEANIIKNDSGIAFMDELEKGIKEIQNKN